MFKTILYILFFVFSLHALAQKNALSGQLLDAESKEPVEFATISIFSGDQLITGGLSDANGNFSIPVDAGTYTVRIEFVAYAARELTNVVVSGNTNLGNIALNVDTQELDELVVEGERTQMELQLDKKVFNIGKDLSNLGGSATDILDNLPSVQVDVEGNVSLRGSDNVRILIDGKPSGLVGLSSNDALRQLNGNLIERVEVITNPSARYDAEGLAGIINIVLRKDSRQGVNGSFQLNTGIPDNHGGSVNMNFKRKWVNFFTNLGMNYRRNPGSGGSYQEFGRPTIEQITERDRTHDRGGLNYSGRFGADFYINDKTTITTSLLYRYSDELNKYRITYRDFFPPTGTDPDSLTIRKEDEVEADENLEYAVNFTRNFVGKGHKLTFDVQYQNNNEVEDGDQVETSGAFGDAQEEVINQRSLNDELEERWLIQGDYIRPLSTNAKFETGFRITDRLVGNDYIVENEIAPEVFVVDSGFTNEFEYREIVYAGYAILSNKWGDLSWQIGTRWELTDLNTVLKNTDERSEQYYNNFFPSAFLTYNLDQQNSIQLSYSRRVRRPGGRFLNPFLSITDSRNFWAGNPGLQPVFTDSYELGHLYNNNKTSIYSGLYHRHSDGVYQRIRITEGDVTVTRPFNLTREDAYGLEFNVALEPTKWYRVNGNVNIFRSVTSGGSVTFGNDSTTFSSATANSLTTRLSNNFKFNKWFDAQINVNYRAPQNTVQGKSLSVTSVDIGITRDVLDGNGTIAFNISDLFNSRIWRSETFNEQSFQESEFQWRTRAAQLSFTYRLNQRKERGRKNGEYQGDFEGGDF